MGLLKLLFHWLSNVTQSYNEFLSLYICIYVSLTRVVKFLRLDNSTVIEKETLVLEERSQVECMPILWFAR